MPGATTRVAAAKPAPSDAINTGASVVADGLDAFDAAVLLYRGDWNSSTNYRANDVVSHLGYTYVGIAPSLNHVPPNATYWFLISTNGGVDGFVPVAKSAAYTMAANDWVLATATGITRTVSDGVTNSTTTVTSATAAFVSGDKGKVVTGTGIPADTIISSVTNSTTVVLSNTVATTGTGVTLTIAGLVLTVPTAADGAKVRAKKVDSSPVPVILLPATGTIDGAGYVIITGLNESHDLGGFSANWYEA